MTLLNMHYKLRAQKSWWQIEYIDGVFLIFLPHSNFYFSLAIVIFIWICTTRLKKTSEISMLMSI